MASKKNRSAKRSRKAKSAAPAASTITAAQIVAGAKFGYRLVKSVGRDGVTYVNTNGCKPSNKPATVHTVSRTEFLDLVN